MITIIVSIVCGNQQPGVPLCFGGGGCGKESRGRRCGNPYTAHWDRKPPVRCRYFSLHQSSPESCRRDMAGSVFLSHFQLIGQVSLGTSSPRAAYECMAVCDVYRWPILGNPPRRGGGITAFQCWALVSLRRPPIRRETSLRAWAHSILRIRPPNL